MKSTKIRSVHARQILDSKCRPMVEVDVKTEGGVIGRGGASTGTSVGMYEAFVLRDNNPNCFRGLSVYKAIENVNEIIAPVLKGMNVLDQKAIDARMIELDGTENKTRLGANAIYAVSIACAKAAAHTVNSSLYKYLAPHTIRTLPVPTFNSINGGFYKDLIMPFQEFTFCPYKAENMTEAVHIAFTLFKEIGNVITKFQKGRPASMGHYYGWKPPSEDPEVVMELLHQAVVNCNFEAKIAYALDCASSEMYDPNTDTYYMNGKRINSDEMIAFVKKLTYKYNYLYVEDILDENDWNGFAKAVKEIDRSIIIGDDFIVTNQQRLKKAYQLQAVEGFVFKPNQVGTISEAIDTHIFAKQHNMITVPSQRGGGVLNDVVMDLTLALEAPAVKNSAPRSGERIYALNYLYRAADENPQASLFDFKSLLKFTAVQNKLKSEIAP